MVIKHYNHNKKERLEDKVKVKFAFLPKCIGEDLFIWERYYKIQFTRPSNGDIHYYYGRCAVYTDKAIFAEIMAENFNKYLQNKYGEKFL